MLSRLVLKLCPLMTLAVVTMGCGKKIADSTPAVNNNLNVQGQQNSDLTAIRLDGSKSSWQDYAMPQNAYFEIPEAIYVRAGSTAGKTVTITFNYDPNDGKNFDFKCYYIPSLSSALMEIQGCSDPDGRSLGDMSGGFQEPLEKNSIIRASFTGAAAPDLIVDAVFKMIWK